MKKIFFAFTAMTISIIALSQTTMIKTPILYGSISKTDLSTAPYLEWFNTGYESYQPDVKLITSMKKLNTKDMSIEIFLGTWCGDSKREVPRFLKVLDQLSFPEKNIRVIALGGLDSLFKQSPGKEETGKGIFRVPVFIVYKNGVEINRINEYPVFSLEKDLSVILNNQPYVPNYRTFANVNSWLQDGTLIDRNNNIRGLAMQLRTLAESERELNSLGHLLLGQGKKEEALRVFQLNANLYPESAPVIISLGEGYLATMDRKNAALRLERALELNKDPMQVKTILKLLYEAKGIKE